MTQLDRIEARLQAIDDRTRAIEIRMGELSGEEKAHHWAAGLMKHALTALVAAIAGLAGGHMPLPGGH
jgi:uncharacterized membrane protein YccC